MPKRHKKRKKEQSPTDHSSDLLEGRSVRNPLFENNPARSATAVTVNPATNQSTRQQVNPRPNSPIPQATGPLPPGSQPRPIPPATGQLPPGSQPRPIPPPATGPLPPGSQPRPIPPPATGPLPPGSQPRPIPPATGPLPPGSQPRPIPPATGPLPPGSQPRPIPPATGPLPPGSQPRPIPPTGPLPPGSQPWPIPQPRPIPPTGPLPPGSQSQPNSPIPLANGPLPPGSQPRPIPPATGPLPPGSQPWPNSSIPPATGPLPPGSQPRPIPPGSQPRPNSPVPPGTGPLPPGSQPWPNSSIPPATGPLPPGSQPWPIPPGSQPRPNSPVPPGTGPLPPGSQPWPSQQLPQQLAGQAPRPNSPPPATNPPSLQPSQQRESQQPNSSLSTNPSDQVQSLPRSSSVTAVPPRASLSQPPGQAPRPPGPPGPPATNAARPPAAGQPRPGQVMSRSISVPVVHHQPLGPALNRPIGPAINPGMRPGLQPFGAPAGRQPSFARIAPPEGIPYLPPPQAEVLPQNAALSLCPTFASSVMDCITCRYNRTLLREETDQVSDREETDEVPPIVVDSSKEGCFYRCRHDFAALFSLCCKPKQQLTNDNPPPPDPPAVIVQEVAVPDEYRRSLKSILLDVCCPQPDLNPEMAEDQEATVVIQLISPDEEEPARRKCSFAACCMDCLSKFLDCLCYQPQVRTIPSPYGSEETYVTVQQSTHNETVTRLRQDIVIHLYFEVKTDLEMGLPDEEYEQSCSRRCDQAIDTCCEIPTCVFPNPCADETIKPKKEVMTKTLLKAKEKGARMIRGIGFSFLEDFSKHIFLLWVIPEFVLGLIGFFLSVTTVSLQQNRAFNILHLSLIVLATGLATVDFFETLFKSFKHCFKRCNCRRKKKPSNKQESDDEEKIVDKEGSSDEEEEATTDREEITMIDEIDDEQEKGSEKGSDKSEHESNEEETDNEGEICSCYKNKCRPCCRVATDALRIIVTEVILYPLLICDIFEVTTITEATTHGDRLGIALFVISCIYFILYIYVARIIILIGMIRNVTDIRTPDQIAEYKDFRSEKHYNRNIRRSAVAYQTSFAVHMILQMFAQVLMFIAIGAKMRYDNRHIHESDSENSDEGIRVSGQLWFMIVSGFFLPFMGFLSFFAVTFYWTQEFPIGIYVDMISLMKMTACGGEEIVKFSEKIEEKREEARKIVNQFKKLGDDFHTLRKTSWFTKFSYPFKTPGLVVVCMLYAALQLAFVLCAALTMDDMGNLVIHILNGGGWAIYYLLAVIFGIIANLYVLLVVCFWIIVLTIVLSVLVIVLAILSVTMWCYFTCQCFETYKK